MKSRQFLALAISGLVLIGLIVLSTQLFAQEATPEVTPPAEVTSESTPEVFLETSTPLPEQSPILPSTTASSLSGEQSPVTPIEFGGVQSQPSWSAHPAVAHRPLRIVYVVSENATYRDETLVPNAALETAARYPNVDLHVVTTWEDVRRLDTEIPIEGIIIHDSMFSSADIAWTAQAARRSVAFALINLHYGELGQLWNDTCAQRYPLYNPFEAADEDYFYANFMLYLAEDPNDRLLAYQSELDTCEFNYDLADKVQVLNDAYHYFLRSEAGIGGITHVYDVLFGYVATIRIAEYNFQYMDLPVIATTPTAVPEIQQPTLPLSSP